MSDTINEEKSIYDLELHEKTHFNEWKVLRVSGGWIYQYWDYQMQDYKLQTFIPFNNEFQQGE